MTDPIQSFENGLSVHFSGWSGTEDEWAWIELVFRQPGQPDRRRRFTYSTLVELRVLEDLKQLRDEGNGMAKVMFGAAEIETKT